MTDDHEPGLPAHLELAWGRRDRPAKGPKPALSLDQIVQAAIAVARADGLAAVAMGRVAKELGVATMSLYRYLTAKNDLLALMVDTAYGPPPAAPPTDWPWREGLTTWAHAMLAGFRRDPWLRHAPISTPPIMPNEVRWMEYAIRLLRGTGLTPGEKVATLMAVSGLVRAWATVTLDMAENAATVPAAEPEAFDAYERTLTRLIDAERFPALTELFAAGEPGDPTEPDADFAFGLDRLLDGIESLIRSRAVADAATR